MRTRTTLIALLLLVAASACSGGGSTAASNNTSSSSTSASSTTTTTLPPLTAAGANAALLTLAELPGSFTDQGWAGGSLRQGASCAQSATDPGVDTTVPARVTVGLGAKDATGVALVQEELRAYDDVVTATSAFDTMSRGETCASGTMFRDDGTTFPLQIDPPVDVKADLGTDVATKWVEHAPGFDVQLVAARVGNVIVSFDTVTFSGPFPAFLGSPLDMPKTALAKAKTALIR